MNPSVTENDLSVTEQRDKGGVTSVTLSRAHAPFGCMSRLSRVTVTQRDVTEDRDSDEPSGPVTAKAQVDRWEEEGGLTEVDQSRKAMPSTTLAGLDGSDSIDSLPTVGDVFWAWVRKHERRISWGFVLLIGTGTGCVYLWGAFLVVRSAIRGVLA